MHARMKENNCLKLKPMSNTSVEKTKPHLINFLHTWGLLCKTPDSAVSYRQLKRSGPGKLTSRISADFPWLVRFGSVRLGKDLA